MSAPVHRRERRLIDRHFAGESTPASEGVLRAHLGECVACQAYYDRHLVLADLDPAAPSDAVRLGAGLGFVAARAPVAAPWRLAVVAATAAAAVVFLVVRPRGPEAEFAARGLATASPALHVWRTLDRSARPTVAEIGDGGALRADDELTFSYENPAGFLHLMILGVDEHGHVYWYHPEAEGAGNTGGVAIPIAAGQAAQKLTVGITHALDGRSLRLVSLWARERLTTAQVGGLVDASGCQGLQGKLPEVLCRETKLTVETGTGAGQ